MPAVDGISPQIRRDMDTALQRRRGLISASAVKGNRTYADPEINTNGTNE